VNQNSCFQHGTLFLYKAISLPFFSFVFSLSSSTYFHSLQQQSTVFVATQVSRLAPPKMPKFLLSSSGDRKRALVKEDDDDDDDDDEIHQHKKQHTVPKSANRDNTLDSDIEALFSGSDDDEDAEEADNEPEQGDILWSEDQEEYPPCAVYHPDVKKHQASITSFAVNITNRLSKVCREADEIAKLHAEAAACRKFPELKKIVIALVGDAGSGITPKQNGCGCADSVQEKARSLILSLIHHTLPERYV